MGTVAADVVLRGSRRGAGSGADDGGGCARPRTDFHVTGFAKFHHVSVNPTELLVAALPRYLSDAPLDPACHLVSAQTLKVAAETSRAELDKLYARLSDARLLSLSSSSSAPSSSSSAAPAPRQVVLHFGVNVGVTRFALELQARNEATFLCPDELGWTPIMQPIDPAEPRLSVVRTTALPLDTLVADLRRKGFPVDISTDAGRFVCNWVYYHSLARACRSDVLSLFVHVPAESVAPIPEQLRFARALMQCIAQLPSL